MTPREGDAFLTSAMTWTPGPPEALWTGALRASRKFRAGGGRARALASMSAVETCSLISARRTALACRILSRMVLAIRMSAPIISCGGEGPRAGYPAFQDAFGRARFDR